MRNRKYPKYSSAESSVVLLFSGLRTFLAAQWPSFDETAGKCHAFCSLQLRTASCHMGNLNPLRSKTTLNHFSFCMTVIFSGKTENKTKKSPPAHIPKEAQPKVPEWLHTESQVTEAPIT